MKKRIISAAVAVCICLCAVIFPSSVGKAQNNDAKYDDYVNMIPNNEGHAKYIVPNLYRQDASYINVKTFPLVVNGGVEYFPLDIFALYPYLQVVYSKIAHGFYINNTKNNHYVAFDMTTGTTTTHDEQHLDIQGKIFNRTYYVPAEKVCEILEMNFETYDDPVAGIRAARISDSKAKMTLPQLITAYSPVKKDPDSQSDTTVPDSSDIQNPSSGNGNNTQIGSTDYGSDTNNPQNPDFTQNHPDETENNKDNEINRDDKPTDPYTLVKNRYIYMLFDVVGNSNPEKALDTLAKNGVNAAFFVDEAFIKANPDAIRRMITDGHFVGIHFNPVSNDGSLLSHEDMLACINEANEALYLITKTKTRYVCADYGYGDRLNDSGFSDFAINNGYIMCVSSFDAGASDYYRRSQFDTLINKITGDYPMAVRSVVLRFSVKNGTAPLLDDLFEFSDKYPQYMTVSVDEYTFAQ